MIRFTSRLRSPLAISLPFIALAGCVGLDLNALLSPVPQPPASPSPSAGDLPASSASPTPIASPDTASSPATKSSASPTPTPTPKPTVTLAFVMNGLSKTIDQITLDAGGLTGQVRQNYIATGLYPNQLLAIGQTGYVVNSGDATVARFNLKTSAPAGQIDLPTGANPMTVTSTSTGKGMVVNLMAKTAVFVDLGTLAKEATVNIPQGQPGGGVAVAAGKAYAAAVTADYSNYPAISYSFSGVHVFDTAGKSFSRTISLPNDANPLPVAADPSGLIHVGTESGISTIDPATDTVVRTIAFGKKVNSIAFLNADKGYAACDGNGLVAFNPKTGAILRDVASKILVGDSSVGNFKIRGNLAYVPNFASDTVTVVDLVQETKVGTPFAVGDGPQEIAFIEVETE
jgi:hypothetical protein